MNVKKLPWFLGGDNNGGFPEYPSDAPLTEQILTYSSSIDPTITTLRIRTFQVTTPSTLLPVLIVGHGYEQTAEDIGEDNLRRFARYGYLVLAPELRGSSGSGGNSGSIDAAGREVYDVYDGYIYALTQFVNAHPERVSVVGFSGGGGTGLNLVTRFPDLFQVMVDYFGISDYGTDATFGWYQQEPGRQASLQTAVGGTPAAKPDEYGARYAKRDIATNFTGYLYMFHDVDDTSVDVSHSQRVEDEYQLVGRTDYAYNESNSGSTYRWVHAYPSGSNDLQQAEAFWKLKPKTQPIVTIPTSGTLKINGRLKTKLFHIQMTDSSYLNAGRSRIGTVTYDTNANTYSITNDSTLYAVVTVLLPDGRVATGVLDAAETYVFSPVTIAVDGNTPIVWFDAASKKLLSGSDVTVITDKTGGPQCQGYSWQFITARPALLSSDINSLPALEFILGSTEGLSGLRRLDLQGIGAFTYIDVGTGTMVDQGFSANAQTQFSVLSAGSYFYAINNGSAANGSDAGTNAYLVRTVIFDGSQGTNATRLVRRENKVAQTVSFSGTIPSTTESNAASVFNMGKRSYSANYFTGKIAEFMIFNSVLADVGDKEDILKAKYAI